MTGLGALIRRNNKLFFKDKGMFFTSLITPVILLVLYVTFLANVFRDAFVSAVPDGILLDDKLVNSLVGCQLVSSLLAVSCVTVAFCTNLLMVRDKVSGAVRDLHMTPVRRSTIALGYYLSSVLSTLIINTVALVAGLIYVAIQGWYMSFGDVALLFLDVVLLTLFGTALSSVVNFFLSTDGQGSAVGTIVSAGYGFICGAYMPISTFATGLQNALSLLPGTYGTALVRNHALQGVFRQMQAQGYPPQAIAGIQDSVDCHIYSFGHSVSIEAMYGIVVGTIVLFTGIYILFNVITAKRNNTVQPRKLKAKPTADNQTPSGDK